MPQLLTRPQWETLRRLYAAGPLGIPYEGNGYKDAGPWPVLRALREHTPPLAREVVRLDGEKRQVYFVVITEAGTRFYEANEKLHDLYYPPEE